MKGILLFLLLSTFIVAAQGCPDNKVILQLNNGNWAEEISWSITDTTGKLKGIINLLGRETSIRNNSPLLFIFDDGTVEKKFY